MHTPMFKLHPRFNASQEALKCFCPIRNESFGRMTKFKKKYTDTDRVQ